MCFENVPYKVFIVEKIGFRTALRQCEIHSKSQPLLQKICLSYTSEILTAYVRMCLCVHALACVHRLRATLII